MSFQRESRMDDWAKAGLTCTRDVRGVVRLVIDRPAVHNAFDEALIAAMCTAFRHLSLDEAVRAVVLSSAGRTFCAGADIHWMQRASANDFKANLEDARRFSDMMTAMEQCNKPVIARVQGAAYGGGVGLICAADIAIASERARFAVSEAKLGILPSVIGPYLVKAVGQRQARRLALSSTPISSAEALSIGLVHQVVSEAGLDEAVENCLSELLQCGPAAQRAIKELFGQLSDGAITKETREITVNTIARVRAGEEARAGFEAFLTKRPPPWARKN